MKLIIVAVALIPICALADSGLPNQPYIYVEGKAEIQKPADVVTLSFDVVGRQPDQTKANDEVQTKVAKILNVLSANKIGDVDVIAETLRSEPQFEQEDAALRNRGRIIGYTVTRPFQVKVREITSYPKIVDQLIAVAGVEFSSIEGSITQLRVLEDETWSKALIDARESAERTIKAMSMKIDSVYAVSPVSFPEIQGKIFGYSTSSGPARAAQAESTGPRYLLAPVTATQSVHVIYLISPAKQ